MSRPAGRGLVAELGRFVRANLASTIASGIEYLLVTALVLLRVHYLYAATAGAVTGALIDFSLKRHWAFDRSHKGAVHHEGLRYLAVSGTSLALNLAGSYALVDGLGLPAVPGVIAASLVVGFVWNYPLHRYYVFRTSPLATAARS
ncbi:MAG TPA: GtrA family protein [Anaeromyxobacteraceae bacterium]